jgi:hypothetical protein
MTKAQKIALVAIRGEAGRYSLMVKKSTHRKQIVLDWEQLAKELNELADTLEKEWSYPG